jgi:hypothetical protein
MAVAGQKPKFFRLKVMPTLTRTADVDLPCPAPFSKKFSFAPDPNQIYIPHRPVPLEGRFAIVTDVGRGMRWTWRCR